MRSFQPRPRPPRRGLTLVEMLVSLALLLLMMTIIVGVFQAATTSVSAQRVYQELDGTLRQLDAVIRQDLLGATARFTPPLDPTKNLGYFEYAENAFADLQGEDVDDYIRLTVKAPDGQPFNGRMYLPPMGGYAAISSFNQAQLQAYLSTQPVGIQSQFAEVIYFVRNGNLYRRVFLVAPEMQGAVTAGFSGPGGYIPGATVFQFFSASFSGIPLSWQGVNDLSAHPSPSHGSGASAFSPPVLNSLGDLSNRHNRAFYSRYGNDFNSDGIPDDLNQSASGNTVGDGIPDYPPTLYADLNGGSVLNRNPQLVFELGGARPAAAVNPQTMAFPYVFPGAYSQPDPAGATTGNSVGWVHSIDPTGATFNHAPLIEGDDPTLGVPAGAGQQQTWWGFPTWRETLSVNWTDPLVQVSNGGQQSPPLNPLLMATGPMPLPPVLTQPFNDGAGTGLLASSGGNAIINPALWEDDLIATGVRSFDVKAYDDAFPGYVDLGWGDDPRITGLTTQPFIAGNPGSSIAGVASVTSWRGASFDTLNQTFAHEGRMPPTQADLRFDAQTGALNIGDNSAGVVRLRRVWDSWSTDYSMVQSRGYNPGWPAASAGTPIGPPFTQPAFPSYPPPYPMPLRGIQIQIRVVDPRNERIKVLTIRQDFTDKL